MKRALVIGINDYPKNPLHGCVRDATTLSGLLERNGDGSPNFDVRLLTSDVAPVTSEIMAEAVDELFAAAADVALFYFAGHGTLAPPNNSGYLVSQDGKNGAWGLALSTLIQLANAANTRIKSTVIILDSCHAGAAGEAPGSLADDVAAVGNGVIVLSAAHKSGYAAERGGRGVFTDLLVDGLSGSAADIRGNITPAAVYTHVDQTLGSWEQRPIFKANVQFFVNLRSVPPKISPEILRRLPKYFPDENTIFQLDPTFEPDRKNVPEQFRSLPVDENHTRIFAELQKCNRFGLVVPVDYEHMYDAAINSGGCRLTALGVHYRRLAENGRV